MRYTQITDEQEKHMLGRIGCSSIEELFSPVPEQWRFKGMLDLPPGKDELTLQAHMQQLAAKNVTTEQAVCFAGGGAWDHFIPSVVDALASQSSFVTAYTPYQAEASQGALQVFYEYQTMICQLTGMDISNASLYEGGSALAEAVLMARSINARAKVVLPDSVNPDYRQVLQTYLTNLPMHLHVLPTADGVLEADTLSDAVDEQTCAVVIQQPNFFGCLEALDRLAPIAKGNGAILILVVDPISLGMLAPPAQFDADIVVGEGQPLGIPLSLGGPYLGLMACKEKYLRRMPGRVVGATVDAQGRRAFCLTLQTREQHIRRERATSNVCTNEGLLAVRAAIYMAALGKSNFKKLADLCFQKAHYAAGRLAEVPGLELAFHKPFFKEFVIRSTKLSVGQLRRLCNEKGLLVGPDLARWYPNYQDCLLIAVTEKRTCEQIDQLAAVLADACRGAGA